MLRITLCAAAVCSATALLQAQDNPLSNEAKQAWTRTIGNAVAGAEKMPEEHYSYKPTPESMSFKDLVAHTADSAMGACTGYGGERKTAGAAQMTSKADLVGAMKAAQAECEKVYGGITDAKATEMITGGRGGPRSRISTLWGNTVHIEHEYAQMAVLLRLKGFVPPSSDRSGMQQKKK